ncbi:MAG: hypothetical protein GF317_12605 [Candidatus Lokiarchaeota archaeon]|nr:hypothetical protein [Candidatus Lokiarchaeota archaeon]MBD3200488.1 hypothetical protein [Candidatus Lokiarchaeota archaeon]
MNDNGRTYITWQDDTSKFGPNDMGSDNDVFYRYLQDDLTWFGTIFFINTSSNSENPSMAFVGTDRKVVWEETNTTTDHDIYYQNGASPIPLLNDKRTAENPQIACDSDGNIHVVWTDDSNVSGWQLDPDIFYRFYNESSSTWSDVSLVSSGTQYAAMNPKIDLDSDGNAHIIWHEWTFSFPVYHYIKYRSWNKATNSWSSEYIIASANNNQVDNPDIAVDKNDNIYVVWDDSISYTSLGDDSVGDRDIIMKIYDHTASQWGDNLLISIGSNESSLCPCIDTDSNGKAHIAWADRAESLHSSGKDDDIFYVTFTATPPDSGPNNGIPFGNTFILVILISVISIVSIQIKKLNRKI